MFAMGGPVRMQQGGLAGISSSLQNANRSLGSAQQQLQQAIGGGVGMGYSLHAGMVIVADGTPEADKRLKRVLQGDPGMGVVRHVDAGYEIAKDVAKARGVNVPGLT